MWKHWTFKVLTHQSLKLTIVSVKFYYFLYKLSHKKSAKATWLISIFCTPGTNGLIKAKIEADLCIVSSTNVPAIPLLTRHTVLQCQRVSHCHTVTLSG